jgi:hypothetical protein
MIPARGLRDLQRRMAAAVMAPLTARGGMRRRRPDGTAMAAEAAAFIKPNDRLSAFERLEIYNLQYWLRTLDSLEEDFPGLRAILGRRRFDRMARAYLADCPSVSFTLRNLGSRLEAWLRAHPSWLEPHGRLLLDLARLEWAHIEAFDAAAEPVLLAADLGRIDGGTRLRLQPWVRLLDLEHPVDDLLIQARRRAARADGGGNAALPGRRRLLPVPLAAPADRRVHLAVHRHQLTVYYKRLEPEAFAILRAIGAGATLDDAVAAGLQGSALPPDEQAAFLERNFHDWASFGWFAQPPSGVGHGHFR